MRTIAYDNDELLTQKERNKNEQQEHLKRHRKLKPSISQFNGKISDQSTSHVVEQKFQNN